MKNHLCENCGIFFDEPHSEPTINNPFGAEDVCPDCGSTNIIKTEPDHYKENIEQDFGRLGGHAEDIYPIEGEIEFKPKRDISGFLHCFEQILTSFKAICRTFFDRVNTYPVPKQEGKPIIIATGETVYKPADCIQAPSIDHTFMPKSFLNFNNPRHFGLWWSYLRSRELDEKVNVNGLVINYLK